MNFDEFPFLETLFLSHPSWLSSSFWTLTLALVEFPVFCNQICHFGVKFPGEPWASKLFLLTALAASPFCLRLQTFRRLGQLILHDITVLRLGCKWWIWPQPQIHVSVWDKRHQQEVFPPKGIEHNSLLCEWTIDIWNIFRGPTAFCRSPCGQFCSSELGKMHPASIQWSPDRCQFCSSSQLVGMLASAIVRYSGEIKKSPAHLLVFSKPFVPHVFVPK